MALAVETIGAFSEVGTWGFSFTNLPRAHCYEAAERHNSARLTARVAVHTDKTCVRI